MVVMVSQVGALEEPWSRVPLAGRQWARLSWGGSSRGTVFEVRWPEVRLHVSLLSIRCVPSTCTGAGGLRCLSSDPSSHLVRGGGCAQVCGGEVLDRS